MQLDMMQQALQGTLSAQLDLRMQYCCDRRRAANDSLSRWITCRAAAAVASMPLADEAHVQSASTPEETCAAAELGSDATSVDETNFVR